MKRSKSNHDTRWMCAAAIALVLATAQSARAAGPGVHGRVFALDESGTITGTIPGARIELNGQGGAALAPIAAGAGGYYRVDLAPGRYFYKVTAPGYKDEDAGRGFELRLSEGYAVYNFSLTRGENDPDRQPPELPTVEIGKLEGRVLEKTPNGQLTGIAQARITLRPDVRGRKLTRVTSRGPGRRADRIGAYEVRLEAGSWQASVSAEGFETLVDPNPILIQPDATTTRDFVLTRSVPEQPSGQGMMGRITLRGEPVKPNATPQIQVHIIPLGARQSDDESLTPVRNGNYSRDLNVGRYRVVAWAEGYRRAKSSPREVFAGKYTVVNLTLVADRKPEETDQPDEPTLQLLVFRATVYEQLADNRGKRPLPGASVLIRNQAQGVAEAPRGTTDQQGNVKLEVPGAGRYTVLAQKSGYLPAGADVTVSPDGPNRQNILLVKRMPQADVAAETAQDQPAPLEPQPSEPRPTQPRRVIPWRPQPAPRTAETTLNVRILERLPARMTRPVAGSYVFIDQGRRRVALEQSDARGMASFQLKPGAYLIGVKHPGYEAAEESIVLVSGTTDREVYLRRASQVQPQPGQVKPPERVIPWIPRVRPRPERSEPDSASASQATFTVRVYAGSDGRQMTRRPAPRPLAGAQIKVLQGRNLAASGQSDKAGGYGTALKPGTYLLYVVHRDFLPHQERVTISGKSVSRSIVLRPRSTGSGDPSSKPLQIPEIRQHRQQKPSRTLQQNPSTSSRFSPGKSLWNKSTSPSARRAILTTGKPLW